MKALSGMTVVNLSLNLPGPAAARRLLSLGARVVKVEPPGGDPMGRYHGAWYRELAAGQEVRTLDLKIVEERGRFDALLGEADLLLTATRPAALERLDLAWDDLHRRFPRLCQVAIVGFPAPRQNEAGHDLTYQASLGLLIPPHMPRTLVADMAGAEQAAGAALALLLGRQRSGEGGYAEVALSEAAAAMAEPLRFGTTAPGALLGGGIAEYNLYPAAEGWVALAALEPHFKKRLDAALGGLDYSEAFKSKSAAEWQAWGQQLDIPVVAFSGGV
jgi:crotonobetainyl-CoA:carnitine CoA-transferase CaiB-like acyl-CoA transferase